MKSRTKIAVEPSQHAFTNIWRRLTRLEMLVAVSIVQDYIREQRSANALLYSVSAKFDWTFADDTGDIFVTEWTMTDVEAVVAAARIVEATAFGIAYWVPVGNTQTKYVKLKAT